MICVYRKILISSNNQLIRFDVVITIVNNYLFDCYDSKRMNY